MCACECKTYLDGWSIKSIGFVVRSTVWIHKTSDKYKNILSRWIKYVCIRVSSCCMAYMCANVNKCVMYLRSAKYY